MPVKENKQKQNISYRISFHYEMKLKKYEKTGLEFRTRYSGTFRLTFYVDQRYFRTTTAIGRSFQVAGVDVITNANP